jgi:Flp pilus assembly protein TadD
MNRRAPRSERRNPTESNPGPEGPAAVPVTAATPAGPGPSVRWLTLALLAAATFAAFAGVLRNGWVMLDDPLYVTQNPYVNTGVTLRGLQWFLHAPHGGNWHPLTSLSHMLDVQCFGLAPAGPHAVNLALHLLNVLLLVIVLHRLTGAWWRSLLVGALFGLHPLRVESVAWVAERKDVLSAFFFLLTLEAWRRWAARPSARRYALVMAGLALGLMSKPMVVTLPFVLVLLDIWPLGRLRGVVAPAGASECRAPRRPLAGLLLEKWPLIMIAVASAVVTFVVQRQTGAVSAVGIGERLVNATLSYWRYVGMTLWPARLAPFYPFYQVHAVAALVPAAALALATALALWLARTRPAATIGWLWYLGTLVPVIGVVQVGLQSHADRYTYIPCIGLFIAAVWGAGRIARGWVVPAAASSVLVLALLGVATARQVALWKDTRTLFTHARRVTGESVLGEQVLGNACLADSQRTQALQHLRRAVELGPDYVPGLQAYGILLAQGGRLDEADQQFRRVLELEPAHSGAWFSLGRSAQTRGRLDEAAEDYRRALERASETTPLVNRQLGIVSMLRGDLRGGLALIRSAVALTSADVRSHVILAQALVRVPGNDAEAADELRRALRIAPDDREALNELAWLLATSVEPGVRRGSEAESLAFRLATLTGGRDPNLLDTQAAAQAAAGRTGAAAATARQALELAERAGAETLAVAIRGRLASYERGRAWVDSARAAGPSPGPP